MREEGRGGPFVFCLETAPLDQVSFGAAAKEATEALGSAASPFNV